MAKDRYGIPFHPSEYDPDYPRIKCKICGLMNSCNCVHQEFEPWYPRFPILLNGGMIETIEENNIIIDEITSWSIEKIARSEIKDGRLTIANFIHPVLLDQLISSWPTSMDSIEVPGRLQASSNCAEAFNVLHDLIFDNWYVKCTIADKFAFEHEYNASLWLWEDTERFTVNDVHVDFNDFDITFGLYLPGKHNIAEYGTQFWSPNNDEPDLTKSLLRDNCKLIDQLPFINGMCYFMPRTTKSWHSSPILDKPITRRHVYGYYKTI